MTQPANAYKASTLIDNNLILDDGVVAVSGTTPVPGEVDGSALILDLLDPQADGEADLGEIPELVVISKISTRLGDGVSIVLESSTSPTFAQVDNSYDVGSLIGASTTADERRVTVRPNNRYVRCSFVGESGSTTAVTRKETYITWNNS